MEDLVAEFERRHPSTDVVWVDVPFDAMQRKFLAAAAAGRAPDVVNLSDGFYARFVAMGGLTDLHDKLPGDPAEAYFSGALSICRMNGGLYALPWYLAANIAMTNDRLLAEGGLTTETIGDDWTTLRRQAREYHRTTGKFLFAPQLGTESQLPLWIIQDGLPPLRPRRDGAPGLESNLGDPRIVRLVSEWVDLYRSGALPPESAVGGHGAMIDLYQNGRAAMLITGPNFLERIKDAAPEVYAATGVRPSPRGSLQRHELATMLLAVSSQSRHPKEAAELAWFVTNAQNQLAFAKVVSIMPSTPESLNDRHFAGGESKIDRARALSAQCLREADSFVPALPAWPELTRAFEERIKAALLDGADVGQNLDEISGEWNGILASHEPATMAVFTALPQDVRDAAGRREPAAP